MTGIDIDETLIGKARGQVIRERKTAKEQANKAAKTDAPPIKIVLEPKEQAAEPSNAPCIADASSTKRGFPFNINFIAGNVLEAALEQQRFGVILWYVCACTTQSGMVLANESTHESMHGDCGLV
jgi:hypothetical protein